MTRRILALAVAFALVPLACTSDEGAESSPPTMVPNPITNSSSSAPAMLPVVGSACVRMSLCCQQVMAAAGSGAQSSCSQLASIPATPDAERACEEGLASLARTAAATGTVPPACGSTSGFLHFGLGGPPPTTAIPGAAAGRPMPIGVPGTVTGTIESGDATQASGAGYDDYFVSLIGGRPITIVTRGGATTAGPGTTLDMYTILLHDGSELTHDDDGAGYPNSRIVFTPTASGIYVIRVTTFGSGLKSGSYTVQTYDAALPSQT